MKESVKDYKRIVVKIGSSLLYPKWENVDLAFFNRIADQVSSLLNSGKEVIIVSSGAIALGMHELGLRQRPKELRYLQSMSAIGQNVLMNNYLNSFKSKGFHGAQILLTWEDFKRERYLNAKNTILTLLKTYRAVPVINENDTISTDEIRFGDNDQLSARVAALINADLLIILSDVDGLLDKEKKVIRVVGEITPQIKALACPTKKKTCVGGMVTKIEAAKIAMDSGISCVIANGRIENIILSVIKEPQIYGTLFSPKKGLDARERWIAFGTKPKGKVLVDDGAKNALLNNKSLLSVGVVGVVGDFEPADIVSVLDKQNHEFARGKVAISGKQLEKVKGIRVDKEIIHCDNIVIL